MMEEVDLCFPHLNTSCLKPQLLQSQAVPIYIVQSFVSLLTVTLNLLVIISISHFKQLQTPTNLLILSLAVSDFFVGLVMVFQIMLIDGCWYLGDHMCALYIVLDYIATCTSIGIIVLISIDRYVAICDPLHYSTKVTPKRVQVSVLLYWILSLIYVCIIIKSYNSCVGECVKVCTIIEQFTDFIFVFLIPITLTVLLYIRIFVVVVSQARAMRSHITAVTLQRSGKVTAKKSEIKAAGTLGVVIVVFMLCLTPYYGVTMTGQDTLFNASSSSIIMWLYYSNSCLNPMLYAFFYPWFRKCIRFIFTLQILQPGSCDMSML